MTPEFVITFAQQAMEITLLLSLPMLGVGLLVGLVVSVFQATTQIQEMTLQFIPKIMAIMGALVLAAPWMLEKLMSFTGNILLNFPEWIRSGLGAAVSGLAP